MLHDDKVGTCSQSHYSLYSPPPTRLLDVEFP